MLPSGKSRAARVTDRNKTTKKSSSKSATLDPAVSSVNVATDTADICYRANEAAASPSVVIPCLDELSALRQLVQSQQEVINKLQRQLEFVLSYLDIQNTCTNRSTDSTGQPCAGGALIQPDPEQSTTTANINGEVSAGQLAWTEVVSRKTKRSDTLQQSVVTAVYVDQTIKKRHETSLIVSGLKTNGTQSDASTFAALCYDEFQLQPSIAFTKRLGKPETGKIQPLLVVLRPRDQAEQLISSAKLLRRSSNVTVRNTIFINPYMTRAEAAAAYQLRLQRRLSQRRRADQNIRDGTAADNGFGQSAQLSESGSATILPDGVSSQSHVASDCNRTALNPQADSFNPLALSASASG